MRVVVTGAAGFIGRHVVLALRGRAGTTVEGFDVGDDRDALLAAVREADAVVHLAGVNRPKDPAEFRTGNADLTRAVSEAMAAGAPGRTFVLSSSIHAAGDTAYGASKREAETAVAEWAAAHGGRGAVLRLSNVFGKWCRPNYNSAVATFCHAIANGLPFTVNDPAAIVTLLYVDDAVAAILGALDAPPASGTSALLEPGPVRRIALGDLVALIESFREQRTSLRLPDFGDRFVVSLYATWLSYLPGADFAYGLTMHADPRGELAEWIKGPGFGQVFVSRTRPGITRGNHWHHTKTEKFLVVEGDAVVRFRRVDDGTVIEHPVSGREFRVVDIPPGYTHSIQNVGTADMICLFWASEIFDPARPDTTAEAVLHA
jgi:UDP-2-acetamido-2,6-beta-L-arabino-hexul-4-ose reductase